MVDLAKFDEQTAGVSLDFHTQIHELLPRHGAFVSGFVRSHEPSVVVRGGIEALQAGLKSRLLAQWSTEKYSESSLQIR